MVSIVLVGVGGYGAYLFELLRDHVDRESFEIVAVVDPYREGSRIYSEIASIPAFDTLDAYFASCAGRAGQAEGADRVERADLAIIATPIPLHREQTVRCLEEGLHVLCEKPAAALLSDLHAMIAAAKRANRLLGIGFQWSYYDEVLAMKEDILAERFGPVHLAKALVSWPRPISYYSGSWKGRIHLDDGSYALDSVLSNATAHYLHNLLFLLGPSWNRSAMPTELYGAIYRAHDIESYDTVSLDMTFDDDRSMLYTASHAVSDTIEPIFEIICEEGIFGLDRNLDNPRFYAEDAEGVRTYYGDESYSDRQNSLKIQWLIRGAQEFKDSGKLIDLPCDGETAIPHLTLVNAIAFNANIRDIDPQYIDEVDTTVMHGPTIRFLPQAMRESFQYNQPLSGSQLPGLVTEEEISLDLNDTPALHQT